MSAAREGGRSVKFCNKRRPLRSRDETDIDRRRKDSRKKTGNDQKSEWNWDAADPQHLDCRRQLPSTVRQKADRPRHLGPNVYPDIPSMMRFCSSALTPCVGIAFSRQTDWSSLFKNWLLPMRLTRARNVSTGGRDDMLAAACNAPERDRPSSETLCRLQRCCVE